MYESNMLPFAKLASWKQTADSSQVKKNSNTNKKTPPPKN